MTSKFLSSLPSFATDDLGKVAAEWTRFCDLAKAHHLTVFVQSTCFKRYGHFEPDSLDPIQKLDLISELQDALGYAILCDKACRNGNRQTTR